MKRAALILSAALALCSCAQPGRIVEAQKPGTATGAGATLTGPANSAASSTQHAKKTTVYFPPIAPAALPSPAIAANADATPSETAPEIKIPARSIPTPPPPAVAWVSEETTTTLGQHQDAAPLMQAAAAVSRWGWLRWLGVVCILAGIAGWLWSIGHPLGYPVVFLGIAACGVVFLLASESPAWLLTLALPFLFYLAQRLGVLRVK